MKLTATALANAVQIAQAIQDAATLAETIAPILSITPDAAKGPDKATRDAADATLVQSVRAYTDASEEAGIPAARAGAALRYALLNAGKVSGTAANYGRAVEGFRTVPAGEERNNMTLRQAQDAMRSAKQVEKDNAMIALRPYLKAATAAQIAELTAYAKDQLGIVPPVKKAGKATTTQGEADKSEAAPAEAAHG